MWVVGVAAIFVFALIRPLRPSPTSWMANLLLGVLAVLCCALAVWALFSLFSFLSLRSLALAEWLS